MKFKVIVLIFAFSLMSWTQTSTQPSATATPSHNAPTADDKAGCGGCCQKAGSAEDKSANCCQNMKDGKCDMSDCKDPCMGKDKGGMMCMKNDKTKASSASGAEAKCCAGMHPGEI